MLRRFKFIVPSIAIVGASLVTACGPAPTNVTIVTLLSETERQDIRRAIQAGRPIFMEPMEAMGAMDATHPPSESHGPNSDACRSFRARLPRSFRQGFVSVPEDWSAPKGAPGSRKIRVFYYARPGSAAAPSGPRSPGRPVVFFNGGPAASSWSSFNLLESSLEAKRLPTVYIDQRGTGCSDPFPQSPIHADTARRLALYGSRGIVRDAETIRERLFGPKSTWRAFGQSYGGHVVHRYLETAPASLSGAFAHGSSIMGDPTEWLAERLRSQKRIAEEYLRAYPEDRARIRKIRDLIPEARCFEGGGTRLCGPAVLDAATYLLGFQPSWRTLHLWLAAMLDGESPAGSLDERKLQSFVRQLVFGVYAGEANGFASSVLSRLEILPGLRDVEGCRLAQARLEKTAGTDSPADWPFNECRMLSAFRYPWDAAVEEAHPFDPLRVEAIASSLASFPRLPFFLYSGQKDAFVPVASFQEEVTHLGDRIIYRNFPDSGHEGFYAEQQVWTDLLAPL